MADMTFIGADPREALRGAGLMPDGAVVQPLGEEKVREGIEILERYKRGKAALEHKITANEQWYKLRHWQEIGGNTEDPKPTSAWLLNSLMNKHADMMDNCPTPEILPREQSDEQTAQILGKIIPVILGRTGWDETYDRAAWYKLKHGTSCVGVYWDKDAEDGLGEITVRRIDLLNLFWEPEVNDLQDSANVFHVQKRSLDAMRAAYPDADLTGGGGFTMAEYRKDDYSDDSDKVLVIDWYYKKDGLLQYIKFAGGKLLYATENDPALAARGLYDHGKYPFVFDVLYPIEGACYGFGFIDLLRDPQLYIDKLDQIILRNALLAGKPRWFVSDGTDINEHEFTDWSRDLVHVAGRVDEEHVRQMTVNPLNGYIIQHRDTKIQETKETSANRDVSSGGTASGVTAASAIAAMQEAGNKVSRDLLKGTYRAYKRMIELVIELVRQFYDVKRAFRIVMPNGATEYLTVDNTSMLMEGRESIFDVEVAPQKSNPFNRLSQNEFAKELYSAGIFQPQNADQALAMLDMMEFEGKPKVMEKVQQGQTLFAEVQRLKQVAAQMAIQLGQATGSDPTGLLAAIDQTGTVGGAAGAPGQMQGASNKGTAAQAYERAAALAQGAEQRRIERSSPV